MTIYDYILRTYQGTDTLGACHLRSAQKDPTFPKEACRKQTIFDYLELQSVSQNCMDAFAAALEGYQETNPPAPVDLPSANAYVRFYRGPALVLKAAQDDLPGCWEALAAGALRGPADCNSVSSWDELSEPDKLHLLRYIWANFEPMKRTAKRQYNRNHSSYTLKHRYEAVGSYVTNGQFKAAMLLCGYAPEDPAALNWRFKIAPSSPAIALPIDRQSRLDPTPTRCCVISEKFLATTEGKNLSGLWSAMARYSFI